MHYAKNISLKKKYFCIFYLIYERWSFVTNPETIFPWSFCFIRHVSTLMFLLATKKWECCMWSINTKAMGKLIVFYISEKHYSPLLTGNAHAECMQVRFGHARDWQQQRFAAHDNYATPEVKISKYVLHMSYKKLWWEMLTSFYFIV